MFNDSLGSKILGLFISIGLIIGGLSGQLVLRGTDSSVALVVAGSLWLLWDLYRLATHNSDAEAKAFAEKAFADACARFAASIIRATESLPAERSIEIKLTNASLFSNTQYQLHLNGESAGTLSTDCKQITLTTQRVRNTLHTVNKEGTTCYLFFEVTAPEEMLAGYNFTLDGQTGSIACPTPEVMGIKLLELDLDIPEDPAEMPLPDEAEDTAELDDVSTSDQTTTQPQDRDVPARPDDVSAPPPNTTQPPDVPPVSEPQIPTPVAQKAPEMPADLGESSSSGQKLRRTVEVLIFVIVVVLAGILLKNACGKPKVEAPPTEGVPLATETPNPAEADLDPQTPPGAPSENPEASAESPTHGKLLVQEIIIPLEDEEPVTDGAAEAGQTSSGTTSVNGKMVAVAVALALLFIAVVGTLILVRRKKQPPTEEEPVQLAHPGQPDIPPKVMEIPERSTPKPVIPEKKPLVLSLAKPEDETPMPDLPERKPVVLAKIEDTAPIPAGTPSEAHATDSQQRFAAARRVFGIDDGAVANDTLWQDKVQWELGILKQDSTASVAILRKLFMCCADGGGFSLSKRWWEGSIYAVKVLAALPPETSVPLLLDILKRDSRMAGWFTHTQPEAARQLAALGTEAELPALEALLKTPFQHSPVAELKKAIAAITDRAEHEASPTLEDIETVLETQDAETQDVETQVTEMPPKPLDDNSPPVPQKAIPTLLDFATPETFFNLGICHLYGIGVGKDREEAVKWLSKAAEQGHAEAQNVLNQLR